MAHLYFVMKEPGQADRVLVWDTRTLSIGRSPENDLAVDDEEISRKHAMLTNEGGVFEIGDYRTGNGTFVNGQRAGQQQKIKPGDLIGIGKLQLEFREGDEHPAKLGYKLEYASQLKTVGMVPQGADAGATMLGMADTSPPSDDFVIEPERSTGESAFTVGDGSYEDFQMRELDASLDKVDVAFDDALDLMDPLDLAPAIEPPPPAIESPPPATEPAPAARKPAPPARKPPPAATGPAPAASKPAPPATDPNAQTAAGGDPMERLRKLKVLHDEGLITDEEFQAKRAQILKEM